MDFSPVQSSLDEQLNAAHGNAAEEIAAQQEVYERVQKHFEFVGRANRGELTLAEFKALSPQNRKHYSRRFSTPRTPDEIRATEKRHAKAAARAKAAKQARKQSRSR